MSGEYWAAGLAVIIVGLMGYSIGRDVGDWEGYNRRDGEIKRVVPVIQTSQPTTQTSRPAIRASEGKLPKLIDGGR